MEQDALFALDAIGSQATAVAHWLLRHISISSTTGGGFNGKWDDLVDIGVTARWLL